MERLNSMKKYSFLLKGIYWQTQVSGLTPFAYDTLKEKAVPSNVWFLYSNIFTVVLSTLVVIYLCFYSVPSYINEEVNIVFYFVRTFDVCAITLKTIVAYIIQIFNRQKLIDTVNVAKKIRSNLLYLRPKEIIFDKSFRNHFLRVMCITFIQGFSFALYCIESFKDVTGRNSYFDFLLLNFCHLSTSIIIVKMYYHTGMMIGIRLYEIVNDRISEILNNLMEQEIRQSGKCGVAEIEEDIKRIDNLILIFVKITYFIKSVNKLFSIQIVLVIVGCFMFILSSVSIDPDKFNIFIQTIF